MIINEERMLQHLKKAAIFFSMLVNMTPALSAEVVSLDQQNVTFLRSFLPQQKSFATKEESQIKAMGLKEMNRSIDFNQTAHIRMKQTYGGYQVLQGEAILHIPNGAHTGKTFANVMMRAEQSKASNMNGRVYQKLESDLQNSPPIIFSQAQADKAYHEALNHYIKQTGTKPDISKKESQLIIYIDDKNKAHWAFYIYFYGKNGTRPIMPVYI